MNIRKPSDYSSLYSALDVLMGSDLAEMELYCEIGRAVCGRTEKGAAVKRRGISFSEIKSYKLYDRWKP